MKILSVLAAALLLLTGCGAGGSGKAAAVTAITAEQAKTMLGEEADAKLLDVRTQAEYDEGHIEGAILIPDTEIEARAEKELLDKDVPILVYCRSGRRSAAAAKVLAGLGYTKVYDLGGIIDWPYEVVK